MDGVRETGGGYTRSCMICTPRQIYIG